MALFQGNPANMQGLPATKGQPGRNIQELFAVDTNQIISEGCVAKLGSNSGIMGGETLHEALMQVCDPLSTNGASGGDGPVDMTQMLIARNTQNAIAAAQVAR